MALLLSPVGRAILVALLLLAAVGGIYSKGRKDGDAGAVSKINRQTEAAFDAAREAARSVDDCYALDGVRWNVARARCERHP